MRANGRAAPGRGVIGDGRGRGNGASPESLAAAGRGASRGPPAGAWGRGAPPVAVAANPWAAGRGRSIIGPGNGGGGDGIAPRGRGTGRGNGVGGGGPCGNGVGGGGGEGGRGGRGSVAFGSEGREGRMARRRQERDDSFDCVKSRPLDDKGLRTKQAGPGKPPSAPVKMMANYFRVIAKTDWALYHYRVDFRPDETDTRLKKSMLRTHQASFGGNYVFDGSSLFMANRLIRDPLELCSQNGDTKFELTVRMVAQLSPTDPQYLQIFNIIVRKCLEILDLEEMGRHFYDRHQAIRMEAQRLELWPGFKTSMRNHERDILLGVELTHKVLRLDNCLTIINEIKKQRGQQRVASEIVGVIVMTTYNRKTYKVDDIDWTQSPKSTFDMLGQQVAFKDYFRQKYDLHIKDVNQPMLISRPKKKDFHRGMTGPILLIPELCQMTGLTDEMRSNNNLMRALSTHLHIDPQARVVRLREFIRRMISHTEIKKELERWGLLFQDRLTEFGGHVIPKEKILFANGQLEDPDDRYDWSRAFRSKAMYSTVELKCWVVIVSSRDDPLVEKLVGMMQRVGQQMKFRIDRPSDKIKLSDPHPGNYAQAVTQAMNKFQNRMQMIFAILPRQATDTYSAIKRSTCADYGVLSQCFVAKNAQNEKNLMSICTKLVVQMNAKLGGEPWTVNIPLTKLMVVGFDVYHCGKRRGASVGALVASLTPSFGRYFSTVAFHSSKEELSSKIANDFAQGLDTYRARNNCLPDRIMFFRDGVGDGQLRYVYETELEGIKARIKEVYEKAGAPPPKMSFIVVTKRINTRIFKLDGTQPSNPPPGCIADDVITLPERYDFYLVSQYTRQGTVAPVSYNVLFDESGIDCDKIQRLTFKLCHLYYNWSGTVTVPAVCQYAHKLAYLTGLSLNGQAGHQQLSTKLYYL